MKFKSLSVFFPFHNEEKNVQLTIEKAFAVLKQLSLKEYEVLCINDGSTDKTLEILEKLKTRYPEIKIINHKINQGYGGALKSGFYNAKYDWIVFTDADGQFDFSEISKFIKEEDETNADLVIGYYIDRKVSNFAKFTSKIWELGVFILFGLKVTDIDCAFKLISKKVIDDIPHLQSKIGAFISSELLIKAKKQGFKITEVGVHHFARKTGKASGRKLKVIINSYLDLFKLWWKLK